MSAHWLALQQLSRAGAHRRPDARQQRRVVLNNTIALLLVVNTWTYVPVLYALRAQALALLLLPLGASFLLPVWLNHSGWHTASRFSLLTIPNLLVFAYSIALGLRGEINLYFAAICLPFILCEVQQRALIAWGVGLPLAFALISTSGDAWMGAHLLSLRAEQNFHLFTTISACAIILSILLSFELSNASSERALQGAAEDRQQLLTRLTDGFAQLSELQARQNAVLEACNAVPWEVSLDRDAMTFTYIAPQVERFVGWSADRFTEAGFFARCVHPDDRKELVTSFLTAPVGQQQTIEYRFQCKDGSFATVRADFRREPDKSGVRIFRGLTIDLTKERALELELRRAQKLESVGRLAAGVAHEINTPLQYVGDGIHFTRGGVDAMRTAIVGYRGFIRRVADGSATARDREAIDEKEREGNLDYFIENVPPAIDQAVAGVERVSTIVRSMTDFARPDSAEKSLEDINRALLSTLTVAHHSFAAVAEVETSLAELPAIRCFPGSLNQVFLTLIINAGEAISAAVNGAAKKGLIRVTTAREQESVVISISDSGLGIPESMKPRIFDPFFTTKDVGKGTGQGLAAAWRIVNNHGGAIWFESVAGRGTTFFIRLPIEA